MTYGNVVARTKHFFRNDIFTALVGLLIVMVVAGMPMTVMAAEKQSSKKVQSEQLINKVNINKAEAPLLAATLKGVGMKKAEAIVAWRKKHGKFRTLEQLVEVKGIGEKTIDKNRSRIVL